MTGSASAATQLTEHQLDTVVAGCAGNAGGLCGVDRVVQTNQGSALPIPSTLDGGFANARSQWFAHAVEPFQTMWFSCQSACAVVPYSLNNLP